MDEKLFTGEKTVNGIHSGSPYELKYDPRKDIKGEYSIQVRYGLMSGLDPSRALIFSLQALGADLISRDFVMRELPWSMNVTGEQERIDIQKMRDNLNASIQAMAQAIPQMATQGADPSDIVMKMAEVIKERQKGTSIEDAVSEIFAPPPPPEAAPQAAPGEVVPPVEQSPVPTAPGEAAPGAPTPQAPPNLQAILGQLAG